MESSSRVWTKIQWHLMPNSVTWTVSCPCQLLPLNTVLLIMGSNLGQWASFPSGRPNFLTRFLLVEFSSGLGRHIDCKTPLLATKLQMYGIFCPLVLISSAFFFLGTPEVYKPSGRSSPRSLLLPESPL